MIWNIPGEHAFDRIEELYKYLQSFPDSALAPAIRQEIAYLESLL